jgi:hypothetical protein
VFTFKLLSHEKVMIICVFLFFVFQSVAQEINKLTDGMSIKKGTIVLDNGQKKQFTDLKLEGMSMTYLDLQGARCNSELSSVYTIAQYKNYVKKGVIWGGAGGFFFGFFFASVGTDDQTFQPLHYLGGALIGTVIGGSFGAFMGWLRSREVVCYKNGANFRPSMGFVFQPAYGVNMDRQYVPGLSLKFTF